MTDSNDENGRPSATQALAALVARRKAAAAASPQGAPLPGRRGPERAAAAHSASKSKPALRK